MQLSGISRLQIKINYYLCNSLILRINDSSLLHKKHKKPSGIDAVIILPA